MRHPDFAEREGGLNQKSKSFVQKMSQVNGVLRKLLQLKRIKNWNLGEKSSQPQEASRDFFWQHNLDNISRAFEALKKLNCKNSQVI